jgi:hypothetical protein
MTPEPVWFWIAGTVGFVVTMIVGVGVRCALSYAEVGASASTVPPGVAPEKWQRAMNFADFGGAKFLGRLERIFFSAILWLAKDGATAIAAWLAFKLASKWYGWQHLVKMPEIAGALSDVTVEEFHARNAWGTRAVNRFLIGTLYNILAATAGLAAGKLTLTASDAITSSLVRALRPLVSP